jgi:hypothetical protein
MLPSCRIIFSHPRHNIVMRAVPVEFVLCISNLFKIKIIINTNLKFVKPCIDIRYPFRMSGYLTPLKQWNLHRQFKRR